MPHDSLLSLKTDRSFLDRLHRAARAPVSPHDRLEQRVSYALSVVKSNVTREQVKELILDHQGVSRNSTAS